MATKEYHTELEEVQDLMELKNTLGWDDQDPAYTSRLKIINQKWLKKLKQEGKQKAIHISESDKAEPEEKVKWHMDQVVHVDKKSKDFAQVKACLDSFIKGDWKVPKKARGNDKWRHYICVDSKGKEKHFKVVKAEKGYNFYGGMAWGKPLPESDPDSDDSDGQDGAGDAGASAKPTNKAKDTPGVSSAKPVKKRASEAAKAAQAGPSSVAPGRPKRSKPQ